MGLAHFCHNLRYGIGMEKRVGMRDTRTHEQIWSASIRTLPLLSAEEERTLVAESRQRGGEWARDELLLRNQRLIISIAARYAHLVPLLDLVNEANIALIRALPKYTPTKSRFGTWATYWIKQACARAVENYGHTVRVPVHAAIPLRRVLARQATLSAEQEREVGWEEAARAEGYKAEKDLDWMRRGRHADTSLDLEVAGGDSGETFTRGEKVAARPEDSEPATIVEAEQEVALRSQRVEQLLHALLTPKERRVVELRYGLDGGDGGEGRTLEEVGTIMGFTRERARQLEQRALFIMRWGHRPAGKLPKPLA